MAEDDEPRGAEAEGLRRHERYGQPEAAAEEDDRPRDRLGVEELGRASLGGERENPDDERRERHEQEDELDERGGCPRDLGAPISQFIITNVMSRLRSGTHAEVNSAAGSAVEDPARRPGAPYELARPGAEREGPVRAATDSVALLTARFRWTITN